MKAAALLILCCVVFSRDAQADRQYIEDVDRSFIGVLDLSKRYGGYEEWLRAAWGVEDPELAFELSDGSPSTSVTNRLKATQFTMLETSYEYPSVLVYGRMNNPRQGDWIQVHIDGEPKWLRMQDARNFSTYTSLFDLGRVAYLLDQDIMIAENPGGKTIRKVFTPSDQNITTSSTHWNPEISVIGEATITLFSQETGKRTTRNWFKIKVTDQPSCGGVEEAKVIAEGWIPARRDDGEISVWFYPRGC